MDDLPGAVHLLLRDRFNGNAQSTKYMFIIASSKWMIFQEQYIFLHEAVLVGLSVAGSLHKRDDLPEAITELRTPNSEGHTKMAAEFKVSVGIAKDATQVEVCSMGLNLR
jgi:hypothetical protein